jgi:hypothetical protein
VQRLTGRPQGRCRACTSEHRGEAERLIARGVPFYKVAAKFGLHNVGLANHWKRHVSEEVKAELRGGEDIERMGELVATENESGLHHFRRVRNKLYAHFDAAGEAKDRLNIDRLAGRLHGNFRDTARITGELERSPLLLQQNNFLSNAGNARVIAAIVTAVSPFPEAARAVTAALRRLEESEVKQIEHVATAAD